MTEEKVIEDWRYLFSKLSAREGKYTRNMNRYNNNGVRRESIWNPHTAPQAYVTPAQGTEGVQTQLNLLMSTTDSITSRISQANVRPFINSVNGNHDTQIAARDAQQFFDVWLDEQHAYPKSVQCFRDAAIFDLGVMYVDPLGKSIRHIRPWEYFVDPAEYDHGELTRAMYLRNYYPLAGLIDRENKDKYPKEVLSDLENDPHKQGQYAVYYDLYGGEVWQIWEGKKLCEPQKIEFSQYGGLYRRPFVEMFYTRPLRGFYGVSLVDVVYPIQRQVDELVRRLDQASRKALLNMIFVPEGSGLKPSNLENGVTAYGVRGEGAGGVNVVTPPAINPQFVQLLEMYIEKAYQFVGMSQLSAQSQKPSGLDSGKALQTMEDIESDRFNTQLQQFTHFLVDVCRVAIDVFPKADPILPVDIGRTKMTWGQLRAKRDLFAIQFSAANSLSKDPEEKRAEIEFMIQKGVITDADVARFYQQPDLERVYTLASSAADYADKILDDAIATGDVSYAESVDLNLLKAKCLAKLNQLMAAGDDAVYVDRVVELLTKVLGDLQNVATALNPAGAPPPQMPEDLSLNGIQIQSVVTVSQSVSAGTLAPDSARAILAISFPNADQSALDAIIQGAANNPITQTPGAVPPQNPSLGGMA